MKVRARNKPISSTYCTRHACCEREGATTTTLVLAATHRPRDLQPAFVVVPAMRADQFPVIIMDLAARFSDAFGD